jgi:serine/threonine protein phosphatase PrpC
MTDSVASESPATAQITGDRSTQEDTLAVHLLDADTCEGKGDCLLVLADGMGGHAAGEVASGLAVEKFSAAYINSHDNVIDALRNSLDFANEQLAGAVLATPEYKGMGTTLTGTVIRNNHMYWVSVGDSPLWIFTNGFLRRVNADHSMVPLLDEMVTHGAMHRKEALTDFRRNLLRSAVTGNEIKLVDLCQGPVQLVAGDMVMLASDGIETLSEHELATVLSNPCNGSLQELADELLTLVAAAGKSGQDNASVILYRH